MAAKISKNKSIFPYEEEGDHPLAIFSEEVWRIFWNSVNDPCDRLNLIKSHSFFENLFADEFESCQFAAIVPIFLPYLEPIHLPLMDRKLHTETFLNIRLVNSQSLKAVDKYIDGHWSKNTYVPFDLHAFQKRSFTYETFQRNLLSFIKINPFFKGYAGFNLVQNSQAFQTDILKVLNRHGRQIRSIRLSMKPKHPSLFFKKAFAHTPNLQIIELFIDHVQSNYEILPNLDVEDQAMHLPRTLPNLPKLHRLIIHGGTNLSSEELLRVMKYFKKTAYLQLDYELLKKIQQLVQIKTNIETRRIVRTPKEILELTELQVDFRNVIVYSKSELRKLYREAAQVILSFELPKLQKVKFTGLSYAWMEWRENDERGWLERNRSSRNLMTGWAWNLLSKMLLFFTILFLAFLICYKYFR